MSQGHKGSSFRIRTSPRIEYIYQNSADIFLESAVTAPGLYPFSADLDGDIQIRGTVRTVLTFINGTNTVPFFWNNIGAEYILSE